MSWNGDVGLGCPLRDRLTRTYSSAVDAVIGADGANSRVAKDIDAGEYDYAIAFQVSVVAFL